jgi:hypothetical protein
VPDAAGVLDPAGLGEAGVLEAAAVLAADAEPGDAGTPDGAGELDPGAEPVSAEVADVTAGRAWPATEAGAALPAGSALCAAAVPGPVAADAGLAVSSDRPTNRPRPTTAMPAAHKQSRRTLVTRAGNPLVTSVTITRHSWRVQDLRRIRPEVTGTY